MPLFCKGKELCAAFYEEAVLPILREDFPGMPHAAGLLGYGSDVLGYDDEVSTDHMWGPRLYLFLRGEDLGRKEAVLGRLGERLPYTFRGYSVHFSDPDPNDNGVRHPVFIHEGPVSPLIWVNTVRGFLEGYLGGGFPENWSAAEWLACSEHRLLAVAKGTFFRDEIGAAEVLKPLSFYPDAVRRYLLASNWSLIAEEQAFLRRCGDVGDDTGSRLVCARMAERLMRLAFLYCGQYAPYSKWFGTAFRELPISPALGEAVADALAASSLPEREDAMIRAQLAAADLHGQSGFTPPLRAQESRYFGREIRVIWADRFAEALAATLKGTTLEGVPLFGSMSEVANFTALSDSPARAKRLRELYRP